MPKRVSVWPLLLTTLLTACGGGGGSADSPPPAPTVLTGTLVDSPVAGVSYRTATQSGVTSATGQFSYVLGETVVFTIGNVQLPQVTANVTLTPLDLAQTLDPNNQVVLNILVLLQSLDLDGNPANGVSIPAQAAAAAATGIDFNVDPTTFANSPAVLALVANSGSSNKTLVSAATALANFQATLNGGNGGSKINVAPFAVAGPAQAVATGTTVTFNGAGSSDANGDALTYSWTLTSQPAGSSAILTGTTTVNPTLVPDVAGTYVASLVVNDGALGSTASTVTVTAQVLNVAPTANAGAAQSVVTGTTVALSGAASQDANSDPITYAWTLTSRPAGSAATLTGATLVNPSFVADVAGSYVASLVVNDGKLSSAEAATVTITAAAANVAPVAHAGTNQDVTMALGAVVNLDGSASSDANGDTLSYAWAFVSKPQGSTAALARATTANPSLEPDVYGAYVMSLTVSDGKLSSAVANVTVTVHALNAPPVANAGSAQSVATGTTVTLSGAASTDANGDLLSYAWSLVSAPAGSSAALTGASTVNPSLVPDLAGSYVFSLTVNDGTVNSVAASTVIISAFVPNAPPVAHAGSAQSVATGSTVTLSGAASSDANGDTLTYAWTVVSKPAGSTAALAGAGTVNPNFVADLAGSYVFSLVVNDGQANSAAASNVTISAYVPNVPPVAHAGTAQTVATGATVTLSGAASSDANGDTLSYAWTFVSKPAGSTATLTGGSTVSPSFVADLAGSYVFSLVVNDGQDNSTAAANVTTTAITYPSLSLAASATVTTGGYTGQGSNDRPVPNNTGVVYTGAAKTFGPYRVTGLGGPTAVSTFGTLAAYSGVRVNGAAAVANATLNDGDLVTLQVDLATFALDNGPLGYGQLLQPRLRVGTLVTITFGSSSGGGILLCTDPTLPPNPGNTVCP